MERKDRRIIGRAAVIASLVFSGFEAPRLVVAEENPQLCELTGRAWNGRASYYSQEGCLGCRADQRMANGEIFDDQKFTLAFMRVPLDSWVLVTNMDNGLSKQARVTDRGGFEPQRIADLSKGLAEYLEMKTDESRVEVAELGCKTVELPTESVAESEESPIPVENSLPSEFGVLEGWMDKD